jgi:hypothetical protein
MWDVTPNSLAKTAMEKEMIPIFNAPSAECAYNIPFIAPLQ